MIIISCTGVLVRYNICKWWIIIIIKRRLWASGVGGCDPFDVIILYNTCKKRVVLYYRHRQSVLNLPFKIKIIKSWKKESREKTFSCTIIIPHLWSRLYYILYRSLTRLTNTTLRRNERKTFTRCGNVDRRRPYYIPTL